MVVQACCNVTGGVPQPAISRTKCRILLRKTEENMEYSNNGDNFVSSGLDKQNFTEH